MDKSKELKTTHDVVMEVLKSNPGSRCSDNRLYYIVCKIIGLKNGINIDSMSTPEFFLRMKEYNLPNYETVRRTRQKIQASFQELSASSDVESMRSMNEEAFRKYAREMV